MPIEDYTGNKKYDFEEIILTKDCDIDGILNNFFTKHKEVIHSGEDIEYIKYKIKQVNKEDARYMEILNESMCNIMNMVGKMSYVKHYVIPELNNGKEYYVYCIHTFIN